MIATIQKHEEEFTTTPNAGWMNGKFYLISAGNGIKRVYSRQCADLPAFARGANDPVSICRAASKALENAGQDRGFSAAVYAAAGEAFAAAYDALTDSQRDNLPGFMHGQRNRIK